MMQGSPDFFAITKKRHNALQGGEINVLEPKKRLYEEIGCENVAGNYLDQDTMICLRSAVHSAIVV